MAAVSNKKKANISIMIAIFCVAFLGFCAFAIDMAFVTINRAKLQRATETTAMASVARYKSENKDVSEKLFNLFRTKYDSISQAKITSVKYKKEANGTFKIKLSTSLMSPTYFLRFAGVGGIKIEAVSYAQTYQQKIENKPFGKILTLNDTMSDKKGADFTIKTKGYSNGYFVFAGVKNKNGNIVWADAGCKAINTTPPKKNVNGNSFSLICASAQDFDLSKPCGGGSNINVVRYFRLQGANIGDCGGFPSMKKDAVEEIKDKLKKTAAFTDALWIAKFPLKDKEGNDIPWDKLIMPPIPAFPITKQWLLSLFPIPPENPYELTILNNVKLITGDNF